MLQLCASVSVPVARGCGSALALGAGIGEDHHEDNRSRSASARCSRNSAPAAFATTHDIRTERLREQPKVNSNCEDQMGSDVQQRPNGPAHRV